MRSSVHPTLPYLGEVSFRRAAATDVIAFVTAILTSFAITCLVLLYAYVGWFGGRPPKESPGEIVFGYTLILMATAAVLMWRARTIENTLKTGTVVTARVVHGSHYQCFVHLGVEYDRDATRVRKYLILPSTKATRALIDEPEIDLAVDPNRPRRVAVRSLYVNPEGATV